MPFLKKDTLVEVIWEDAWAESRWSEGNEIEPLLIRSVGAVVRHDKKGLALASGYSIEDKSYVLGMHYVPAGMIRKVRVLGYK